MAYHPISALMMAGIRERFFKSTQYELLGIKHLLAMDNKQIPQDAVVISNKLFANAETDKVKLDSIMQVPFTDERYVDLSNDLLSIYYSRSTIVSCFSERQSYMECYYFSNMDIDDIQARAKCIFGFYNENEKCKTNL